MGTAPWIFSLSYVCSESGIQFPRTFVLQVDNAAAQAFASQTTYSGRSRLRHVDARQEWVQALRDSKLVKAVHVDTTENLSDLFTKALDLATFHAGWNMVQPFTSCRLYSAEVLLSTGGTAMRNGALSVLRARQLIITMPRKQLII